MGTFSIDKNNNALPFLENRYGDNGQQRKTMTISHAQQGQLKDYTDVTMWCRKWDKYSPWSK